MDNKLEYQAEIFSNRLKRKYKELRKWARKNRISCYRLYDRDIPEIPISIDLYEFLPSDCTNTIEVAKNLSEQNNRISQNDVFIENEIKERTFVILYLYERPYRKSDEEEELWLEKMAKSTSVVLGIPRNHIITKHRKQQKGLNQYEKIENKSQNIQNTDFSSSNQTLIQEQGQIFKINLNSYLDNGIFFDNRPLRQQIREISSGKSVLNLFCYTGSFSVYAASGNAKFVESVDLSNTYINWAKENMQLNGFSDKKKYVFTKTDCIRFLQEKAILQKKIISKTINEQELQNSRTYDIIILDPPTFSNSKNTYNVLDINKDWPQLVKDCLNILNPKGILYFCTNSEKLRFDISKIPENTISGFKIFSEDITTKTIPKDFEGRKPHHCYKFWI